MKRAGVILFTLFYMLVSAGVSINAHYCHNELKSVSFYADASHCCCESTESLYSCCTDEFFQLQLEDNQQTAQVTTQLLSIDYFPLSALFPAYVEGGDNDDTASFATFDQPPPKLPPVYILYCSLTYYG